MSPIHLPSLPHISSYNREISTLACETHLSQQMVLCYQKSFINLQFAHLCKSYLMINPLIISPHPPLHTDLCSYISSNSIDFSTCGGSDHFSDHLSRYLHWLNMNWFSSEKGWIKAINHKQFVSADSFRLHNGLYQTTAAACFNKDGNRWFSAPCVFTGEPRINRLQKWNLMKAGLTLAARILTLDWRYSIFDRCSHLCPEAPFVCASIWVCLLCQGAN